MELKDMTIEELEARKVAIGSELESEGADLDALEAETKSINAELETRKAEEAKKAEIRHLVDAFIPPPLAKLQVQTESLL